MSGIAVIAILAESDATVIDVGRKSAHMREEQIHKLLSGEATGVKPAVTRAALQAAAGGYCLATSARNLTFDLGLRKPTDLGAPTVSVGNLTTGGTGKTPFVMDIVRRMLAMQMKPAILLRGYGGQTVDGAPAGGVPGPRYTSDEQQLYEAELGGQVPIAADPDRVRSARYVLHTHPQTDIIVLDDAFQHRQVRRDLDLVLVDATNPFGYGHHLPRGLMRERRSALKRADAVIITRADQVSPDELTQVDREVMTLTGHAPLAHCAHYWHGFTNEFEAKIKGHKLKDQRIFATCGIGNAASFEAMVHANVREVAGFRVWPDHHDYTRDDLDQIMAEADEAGADAVLTTDKDWIKLKTLLDDADDLLMSIYRPALRLTFIDGGDALDQHLRVLPDQAGPIF